MSAKYRFFRLRETHDGITTYKADKATNIEACDEGLRVSRPGWPAPRLFPWANIHYAEETPSPAKGSK